MSFALWPATLPQEPRNANYQESFAPMVSTFQPDAGPPTIWPKLTIKSSQVACSFRMTDTQRDAFLTFYRTTLSGGTLPFTWRNPAYSITTITTTPTPIPIPDSSGAVLWDDGAGMLWDDGDRLCWDTSEMIIDVETETTPAPLDYYIFDPQNPPRITPASYRAWDVACNLIRVAST